MQYVVALGCIALSALAGCGALEPELAPGDETVETAPIVGGRASSARPEIGTINGCTATLVNPSYLITAAHCVDFATGPYAATASIDGIERSTTRSYALGGGLDSNDVAFIRLASPITTVAPTSIAFSHPTRGSTVTLFGFGCQSFPPVGGGFKQAFSFPWGQSTEMGCPGDSGGPLVIGAESGRGPVAFVDSANGRGQNPDLWGDAVKHRAALPAVVAFGQTQEIDDHVGDFPAWAATSGARAIAGDFNGDGFGDVALTGPDGWGGIPIAFGDGAGGFSITNLDVATFPSLVSQARSVVAGDFNGDGATDIALVGGPGWTTIPIAISNRNGTFTLSNLQSPSLAAWARVPGAYAVAGDFDADGASDIALLGGRSWSSIPVGFSNRDGTFRVTNLDVTNLPGWSRAAGARGLVADFDGDGDADIALAGGARWDFVAVAFSNRDGSFSVTNKIVTGFATAARTPNAKLVAGDFDGDGAADLAAVGGSGWRTVAFALSDRFGGFQFASFPMPNFPAWGQAAPFFLAAKLNADATTDLVLTGAPGWSGVRGALLRR